MSLIKCDSSVVQLVKPSTAKRHKSIETTMKAAVNHLIVDAVTLLRCTALGGAPALGGDLMMRDGSRQELHLRSGRGHLAPSPLRHTRDKQQFISN